jgi:hypothetical protein
MIRLHCSIYAPFRVPRVCFKLSVDLVEAGKIENPSEKAWHVRKTRLRTAFLSQEHRSAVRSGVSLQITRDPWKVTMEVDLAERMGRIGILAYNASPPE